MGLSELHLTGVPVGLVCQKDGKLLVIATLRADGACPAPAPQPTPPPASDSESPQLKSTTASATVAQRKVAKQNAKQQATAKKK